MALVHERDAPWTAAAGKAARRKARGARSAEKNLVTSREAAKHDAGLRPPPGRARCVVRRGCMVMASHRSHYPHRAADPFCSSLRAAYSVVSPRKRIAFMVSSRADISLTRRGLPGGRRRRAVLHHRLTHGHDLRCGILTQLRRREGVPRRPCLGELVILSSDNGHPTRSSTWRGMHHRHRPSHAAHAAVRHHHLHHRQHHLDHARRVAAHHDLPRYSSFIPAAPGRAWRGAGQRWGLCLRNCHRGRQGDCRKACADRV